MIIYLNEYEKELAQEYANKLGMVVSSLEIQYKATLIPELITKPPLQENDEGVDCAFYQPDDIDWKEVYEGGIKFALLKATEGIDGQDSDFERNYKESFLAQLYRGPYHFFRGEMDGERQAHNFVGRVWEMKMGMPELPFFLDVEEHPRFPFRDKIAYTDRFEQCLEVTDRETGKITGIYTSYSEWIKNIDPARLTKFGNRPLWVAHWTRAASPTLPTGWTDYMIWQYSTPAVSWHKPVIGIGQKVDRNRWNVK